MPKSRQRLTAKPKFYFLSFYTLFILLLLLIGFWAVMYLGGFFGVNGPLVTPTPTPDKFEMACTSEAKQCPDGNYVGRTGPNCQFVCPQ